MVKVLLDSDQVEALLRAARSPRLQIHDCGWNVLFGHSMGWDTVATTALRAYLALNVQEAVPGLQSHNDGVHWRYLWRHLRWEVLDSRDYDAQRLPQVRAWLGFAGGTDRRLYGADAMPEPPGEARHEYLRSAFGCYISMT